MEIKINVSRPNTYLISAMIFIAIGVFIAQAYGTNDPTTFGHDAGELEGVIREATWIDSPVAIISTTTTGLHSIAAGSTVVGTGNFVLPSDTKEVLLDGWFRPNAGDGNLMEIDLILPAGPSGTRVFLIGHSSNTHNAEVNNLAWVPLDENGELDLQVYTVGATAIVRIQAYR